MSKVAQPPMYGWDRIPLEETLEVCLEKQIYQASSRVRMTNVMSSRSRIRGNC